MKDMFENNDCLGMFSRKNYQMADSAYTPPFVTMVTSPNISEGSEGKARDFAIAS